MKRESERSSEEEGWSPGRLRGEGHDGDSERLGGTTCL